MKNRKILHAVLRGIRGIPVGVSIGYLLTILTSLVFADGCYAPCVPTLAAAMGSEIRAVIFQAILCGLLGAVFSASSVIWDIEHWGLMKQTGIYFLINTLAMLPTAYFLYWMEHSIAGFLGYLGIFSLIFVLVWIIEFLIAKYTIKKMNANLMNNKNCRK